MHIRITEGSGKNAVTGVFPFINILEDTIMPIPDMCKGHAQKIVDIANQKIRAMRTRHQENMSDAERHIGLLHNSMERVVNAKTPGTHTKALNTMKDIYTGTVQGRSSKTNQFVSPSEHAGLHYGAQKSRNLKILAKQVRDLVTSKIKRNKK